jgi:dTDP-4-dehydrorhamnose reductase
MTSAPSRSDSLAVLVAGASGMLGTALQEVLGKLGMRCAAPAEAEFDITSPPAIREAVRGFSASLRDGERGVLVNAAAYTNVERAEDDRELAFLVNETGAANLARAARDADLAFVHVSTDFVFDGTKSGAYDETDQPNPVSVYGASKLAGERAVFYEMPDALVVRTAWVFAPVGANFPLKIVAAARERGSLSVVTDEVGSPTYTVDLARGILGLAGAGASGIYHLVGGGSCSRFELAREALRLTGLQDVVVEPVSARDFQMKAARPANSVLDCSKAAVLGVTMPLWEDALARCLARTLLS